MTAEIVVFEDIIISLGREIVIKRLRVLLILTEDDSTKLKLVFAANVVMELVIAKE